MACSFAILTRPKIKIITFYISRVLWTKTTESIRFDDEIDININVYNFHFVQFNRFKKKTYICIKCVITHQLCKHRHSPPNIKCAELIIIHDMLFSMQSLTLSLTNLVSLSLFVSIGPCIPDYNQHTILHWNRKVSFFDQFSIDHDHMHMNAVKTIWVDSA